MQVIENPDTGTEVTFYAPEEALERAEEAERNKYGIDTEDEELKEDALQCSPLAGHVLTAYQRNKDAKRDSLIEDEISRALRANNGVYDPEDAARIATDGGSTIYMNLTATKIRAAVSWIRDILLSPSSDPFSLEPTPVSTLPGDIEDILSTHFKQELEKNRLAIIKGKAEEERRENAEQQKKEQVAQQEQPGQPGQPGQPAPPAQPQDNKGMTEGQQRATPPPAPPLPAPEGPQSSLSIEDAQTALLEQNKLERDVREALLEEIQAIARFDMRRLEREVSDQMKEGNWDSALSDFIEDFCVFPTAFMKGPVIQRTKRLHWIRGEAVAFNDYSFTNERVSPYDVYPDPSATDITDGDFIEHMRLSEREVHECIGLPGFREEALLEVIEGGPTGIPISYDTGIEYEKADLEQRGDTHRANENVYHALHFWGSISKEQLIEWDIIPDVRNDKYQSPIDKAKMPWKDEGMKEVEIILVGHKIIKCVLNTDPLCRRPYYKASYQNIPGSFWGRSLPSLMRDIQRMCNACARALATNMGYSAGPMISVNIDRLADSGEIDELRPLQVIQVTNDPTGNSGKPIEPFLIPSVANELMAVYDKFEMKADDATGIPKYAYGNSAGQGGALATAKGLATMLESATKSIKDAIRHISNGLIIPRIEQEVLWTIVNKEIDYNGDINVIAYGAEALASKGANEERRNMFLQTTANQIDQAIMGTEGRAELLREMSKDLGLTSNIVPTKLELRRKEQERAKAEAGKMQAAQQQLAQKEESKLKATSIQIEGQERMSNSAQQVQLQDQQRKQQEHQGKMMMEAQRLDAMLQNSSNKNMNDMKRDVMKDEGKRALADQSTALKVNTGQ